VHFSGRLRNRELLYFDSAQAAGRKLKTRKIKQKKKLLDERTI